MGFTNDWHAMAACRVILGLFEAGFFPVSAVSCPSQDLPCSSQILLTIERRAAFTSFPPGMSDMTWASATRYSTFLVWLLLLSVVSLRLV